MLLPRDSNASPKLSAVAADVVHSVPLLSIDRFRSVSTFRNATDDSEKMSKWTKVQGVKVSRCHLSAALCLPWFAGAARRLASPAAQVHCKDARVLRFTFCPELAWPGSSKSLE